ncbi:MAG: TMEM165/GDT1 family protein [Acidimicrobiales bacterium]
MSLAVAAAVFPVVFLGELPDKTMFASLVMAARGRPLAVWAGAALAFTVHVVIAVSIGVALFEFLPHAVVNVLVVGMFLSGAVYSYRIRNEEENATTGVAAGSAWRTMATSAGVIFLAEWGDLTQILTADLAARYHSPASVGVAALLALWSVAALAVVGGSRLLGRVRVRTLRLATAALLVAIAAYVAVVALLG